MPSLTIISGLSTNMSSITLLLIIQWHTGVCEETFEVDSKIAQKGKIFEISLSNLQEMANVAD